MTTLREAAQAVLDRWDSPRWEWSKHGPTADLMADLRAALAEPVQEPASDFERGFQRGWQRAMRDRDRDALMRAKVEDELAATVARLAEPVQEPVAWLFTNLQSGDYDFCYQEDEHDHDREMWHKQPLYIAPPKPLTDEEIEEINRDLPLLHMQAAKGSVAVIFARAIERAHKIGGDK